MKSAGPCPASVRSRPVLAENAHPFESPLLVDNSHPPRSLALQHHNCSWVMALKPENAGVFGLTGLLFAWTTGFRYMKISTPALQARLSLTLPLVLFR
jgi:hypothetical protein